MFLSSLVLLTSPVPRWIQDDDDDDVIFNHSITFFTIIMVFLRAADNQYENKLL